MDQFVAVALAHFVSLLIPGADFFLIARTAMTRGWRQATGVCVGIATANGVCIAAAFSGLAIVANPTVLVVVQLGGGVFLVWIGTAFVRSNARIDLTGPPPVARTTWVKHVGLGLASGALNPKNALFYLSLASVLAGAPPQTLIAYGVWMFSLVLAWDVGVALALGSRRAVARIGRLLPWLTKTAGVFLIIFGTTMVVTVALPLLPMDPSSPLGLTNR